MNDQQAAARDFELIKLLNLISSHSNTARDQLCVQNEMAQAAARASDIVEAGPALGINGRLVTQAGVAPQQSEKQRMTAASKKMSHGAWQNIMQMMRYAERLQHLLAGDEKPEDGEGGDAAP